MPGGVGGAVSRGTPLSRSRAANGMSLRRRLSSASASARHNASGRSAYRAGAPVATIARLRHARVVDLGMILHSTLSAKSGRFGRGWQKGGSGSKPAASEPRPEIEYGLTRRRPPAVRAVNCTLAAIHPLRPEPTQSAEKRALLAGESSPLLRPPRPVRKQDSLEILVVVLGEPQEDSSASARLPPALEEARQVLDGAALGEGQGVQFVARLARLCDYRQLGPSDLGEALTRDVEITETPPHRHTLIR